MFQCLHYLTSIVYNSQVPEKGLENYHTKQLITGQECLEIKRINFTAEDNLSKLFPGIMSCGYY